MGALIEGHYSAAAPNSAPIGSSFNELWRLGGRLPFADLSIFDMYVFFWLANACGKNDYCLIRFQIELSVSSPSNQVDDDMVLAAGCATRMRTPPTQFSHLPRFRFGESGVFGVLSSSTP